MDTADLVVARTKDEVRVVKLSPQESGSPRGKRLVLNVGLSLPAKDEVLLQEVEVRLARGLVYLSKWRKTLGVLVAVRAPQLLDVLVLSVGSL